MRHFFDGLTSWQGFALSAILILVCVVGILLAGCQTTPTATQEVTASIAVKYATARYIEKAGAPAAQEARAARVLAVLDQVQGIATGDTNVTVDALATFVKGRLPADLSSADRLLAGSLIDVAAAELKSRVGEGSLPATALINVQKVLGWVREAASTYSGS